MFASGLLAQLSYGRDSASLNKPKHTFWDIFRPRTHLPEPGIMSGQSNNENLWERTIVSSTSGWARRSGGVTFAGVVLVAMGAVSLTPAARASDAAVLERIRPIGQVRVREEPKPIAPTPAAPQAKAEPVPAPAAPTQSSSGAGGDKVYQAACMACHAVGVAGAPKVGDKATWGDRHKQGMAALVASVVKGKNVMPPKGGNPALTEAEIRSAVEYMLAETGLSAN